MRRFRQEALSLGLFFPKSKGPLPLLEVIREKLPMRSQGGNGAVA